MCVCVCVIYRGRAQLADKCVTNTIGSISVVVLLPILKNIYPQLYGGLEPPGCKKKNKHNQMGPTTTRWALPQLGVPSNIGLNHNRCPQINAIQRESHLMQFFDSKWIMYKTTPSISNFRLWYGPSWCRRLQAK